MIDQYLEYSTMGIITVKNLWDATLYWSEGIRGEVKNLWEYTKDHIPDRGSEGIHAQTSTPVFSDNLESLKLFLNNLEVGVGTGEISYPLD